jgi:hypothetical protein
MSDVYFLSSGIVSGKGTSGSGKVPVVKRQYAAQILSGSLTPNFNPSSNAFIAVQ